jgi:hypothetical protein
MVSSSNPTVLTQYPRPQKCSPATRLFPKICRWIHTALFPLINPIAKATLSFGAMLKHMWIWSGIRCPSKSPIPRCRHTSRSTSPTCFRSLPYRFLFRYFGMITTCYLQSHRTWDKLCHSCIGSSSLSVRGTFPGKSLFYFSPDR